MRDENWTWFKATQTFLVKLRKGPEARPPQSFSNFKIKEQQMRWNIETRQKRS